MGSCAGSRCCRGRLPLGQLAGLGSPLSLLRPLRIGSPSAGDMDETNPTTIAAIATPPGYGGIGVIRVSGRDALAVVLPLLRSPRGDNRPVDEPTAFQPLRSVLRTIFDPESNVLIDEAVVTWYRGPHSFTGEDVVELSCHGSPVVLSEVLRLLVEAGARLAEPGEFSRRAFFNRRLDLAQVEAINDLIHAQTSYQARLAARQVRGELSRQLQPFRQELIEQIVQLESTVEFVEDDLDPVNLARVLDNLERLIGSIERMAGSYRIGRIVRTGVRLALVGLPNVGKSSVFNALLGSDRAIVTNIPGTTRDTLSESISLNGILLNLIDTAGIRETDDPIERIGVERTRSALVDADLVLAVIEAGSLLPPDEVELLTGGPVSIFVINKTDLGPVLKRGVIDELAGGRPVVEISAATGAGLADLSASLFSLVVDDVRFTDESSIVTNERHHRALLEALLHLRAAATDLRAGFTEEVALDNLHLALRSLGLISGETLIGDIINQIFATFCIGK